MSKLLYRLRDPARSGVYRASRADEIRDAAKDSGLLLVTVQAGKDKAELLQGIARALRFPDWFGHNWDALNDCLGDLSWNEASGHVVIFEQWEQLGSEVRDTLIDILAAVAGNWRGYGEPFFAVFIDPGRKLALPDLFRE